MTMSIKQMLYDKVYSEAWTFAIDFCLIVIALVALPFVVFLITNA